MENKKRTDLDSIVDSLRQQVDSNREQHGIQEPRVNWRLPEESAQPEEKSTMEQIIEKFKDGMSSREDSNDKIDDEKLLKFLNGER